MEGIEIINTNADNILEYGICGYKNIKRDGYTEKIEWLKDRFPEGMDPRNNSEIFDFFQKVGKLIQ